MRKKLLMLALALASAVGALTSSAPTTEADDCPFEVCCPSRGCFCCDDPCAIRCEP